MIMQDKNNFLAAGAASAQNQKKGLTQNTCSMIQTS